MQRKQSLNTTDALLVQVQHDDLSKPNDVLSKLNIEPTDLLVGVIQAVGDFDFEAPIGPQIARLAGSSFLSVVGMVNPVLGAVFSVAAGLFGLVGSNSNQALIQNILVQVRFMITQSLAEFKNNGTEADIAGTVNLIAYADSLAEWVDVCSAFHKDIFKVFTPTCWYDPDGPNCIAWQTVEGGARALIYEIEYSQLMISTYLELRRLSEDDTVNSAAYIDKAEDLAKDIRDAGPLVEKHALVWMHYRMRSDHFVLGHIREAGVGYNVLQGKDKLMHSGNQKDKNSKNDEYTGQHCLMTVRNHRRRAWYPPGTRIKWQEWGRRRAPQDRLNAGLKACRGEWWKSVEKQTHKLVDQSRMVLKFSKALPSR